jgi:hypothetical protein
MGTTNAPQHSNPGIAAVLAYAASGKAGTDARTPNQWVQDTAQAGMLPRGCANTGAGQGKAVGRALRGYVGRGTGNGVGRGSTYPPTTATDLLRLGGYAHKANTADTDKARTAALDKAHSTWQRARARVAPAQDTAAVAAPAQDTPPAQG